MTKDLVEILGAAEKATPVQPGDLMAYEHGGGRLAILRDGKRQLIADFYGDGADRDFYALCDPQTIAAIVKELMSLREALTLIRNVRADVHDSRFRSFALATADIALLTKDTPNANG